MRKYMLYLIISSKDNQFKGCKYELHNFVHIYVHLYSWQYTQKICRRQI